MSVYNEVQNTLHFFKDFYKKNVPKMLEPERMFKPFSNEDLKVIETTMSVTLPEDYKVFLSVADIKISIDGNFDIENVSEVLANWNAIKNWIENDSTRNRNKEDLACNFGVKERIIKNQWLNINWVPFASDGGGNMKCLDLDPAENGTVGQVLDLENQDGSGPQYTKSSSFLHYLNVQKELILQKKYTMEDGFLSINSYL